MTRRVSLPVRIEECAYQFLRLSDERQLVDQSGRGMRFAADRQVKFNRASTVRGDYAEPQYGLPPETVFGALPAQRGPTAGLGRKSVW